MMDTTSPSGCWIRRALHGRKPVKGFLSLMFAVIAVWLTACSGGGGSGSESPVEPRIIDDGDGISGRAAFEGVSLQGAVIALGQLDVSQTQASEQKVGKFVTMSIENFQPFVSDSGTFSFRLPSGVVKEDAIYSLSLSCPEIVTEQCPLAAPLHVVMSGRRLLQGDFSVSILTELVYQRLRYYVAADFDASALLAEMRAIARMVLDDGTNGARGIEYEDLLQWQPSAEGGAPSLKRPQAVTKLAALMRTAQGVARLQHDAQALFAPTAAHLALTGSSRLIAIVGNYAYVVADDARLLTINISQPLQPLLVGETGLDSVVIQEMVATRTNLYLSYQRTDKENEGGLQIMSLADAAHPARAGAAVLEGQPAGLAYLDGVVYVADALSGLHVVDVSNTDSPSRIGGAGALGAACGVAVKGDYAYVTDIYATIHTLNISNHESPVAGPSLFASGRPCAIAVQGDQAVVSAGYGGVHLLSLKEPGNPTLLASEGSLSWARRVRFERDHIFLADADAGLQVFDVSNSLKPRRINSLDTPASAVDVELQGGYAFVADDVSGLQVIDINEQPAPLLVSSLQCGGHGITVSGDRAYMLAPWPGLEVVDISDPAKPLLLTSTPNYSTAYELALNQQLAYLADGEDVKVIDMNNADAPTPYGVVDTSGWANGVAVSGNRAVVSAGSFGVQVLNLSQPDTPEVLGGVETGGYANHAVLDGTWAYVAAGDAGVKVVDISVANPPRVVATVDTPGDAQYLYKSGDNLFVADGNAGMQIISVKNRLLPKIISSVNTPGYARKLILMNGAAYIADDFAGVQIVDVRNPAKPTLVASARTQAGAVSIAQAKNKVLVGTYFGLEIIKLMPLE